MKNKRLLVVAAHPDDEILGCGATLIKYKNQGYKVKVVFLSDGETSRNLDGSTSEKKIQMREKQATKVSSSCFIYLHKSRVKRSTAFITCALF